MTTSTYNVSAQPKREEQKTLVREDQIQSQLPLVEPERTHASTFIFFVLCAALPLTTLAYGTVHAWALATFQASAGIIVLCWIIDAWACGALRVSRNVLQLPLLGLILIGLFQLLPLRAAPETGGITGAVSSISLDPYATRLTVIHIAALLIYFSAALAFIDSPRRLRIITYVIVIFGFALAFIAIIQNIISPTKIYGLLEPKYAVPFGPFVNRHNFAAYMEMSLGMSLGLLFSGAVERDKRLLYLTAIALMGIALLMSQSRGGLISFIASLFFLLILTSFKQDDDGKEQRANGLLILLRVGLIGVFVVMLLVGVAWIGSESSLTRFADMQSAKDPTSNRIGIWRVTLDMIQAHPILGSGLGAYGVAYTALDKNNGTGRAEQAHNDYLQVLADAGIIGAALGIFFLVALFRLAWQRRKTMDTFRRGVATGALTACFAILVHSIFDFTLHITSISILFLSMVALATINGRVEDSEAIHHRRYRRRHKASVTPIKRVEEKEVPLFIADE